MICVVDFGSQYTQLIAKSLRKSGFNCLVFNHNTSLSDLPNDCSGIILSGSPLSINSDFSPSRSLIKSKKPVLGLCFGFQWLAINNNCQLENQQKREYGLAEVKVDCSIKLFAGTPELQSAWMSHGDSIVFNPSSNLLPIAWSTNNVCGFKTQDNKFWGLQFHPEVFHTQFGDKILANFADVICDCKKNWSIKSQYKIIKNNLANTLSPSDKVLCAVSGGVDSTVCAVLLSKVCEVHAVYIDHGFQREYDLSDLKDVFKNYPNIKLTVINASKVFWSELEGVSDPEAKRKIIGRLFIESFLNNIEATEYKYFAQGTIYSDIIESSKGQGKLSQTIKSHHNVGGLPDNLPIDLLEPIKSLFKNEVRELGEELQIEKQFLNRHPFPGPGLSIRCLGKLEKSKIEIIKSADNILYQELVSRGLYYNTWQALCVLLDSKSVGVMGDGRSYQYILAIRCVNSIDAMTATASEIPFKDLQEIGSKIINKVPGINRVLYDVTSKPPSTIEYQ